MENMNSINSKGRIFSNGKATSEDLRQLVCDEMIAIGAPKDKATFPGLYTLALQVADKFRMSKTSVVKYWQTFCEDGDLKPRKSIHKQGRPSKLTDDDLAYIEYLKLERPSITSWEIRKKLVERGSLPDGIALKNINIAVRTKLSIPFSRKRVVHANARRFTDANLQYTQAYINDLQTKNVHQLKFFDESGFQLPDTCNPQYGHAPKGSRCVEINRYAHRPNVTLNLLLGTSGVLYANTVQGASTGLDYLNFFTEAMDASQPNGEPVLSAGDSIVVDNCPTHHCDLADALHNWLDERGVNVIFTPRYSPDFNPCEFCFDKLKLLAKQDYYRDILAENMAAGIYELLDSVTENDATGFYRKTRYLNV